MLYKYYRFILILKIALLIVGGFLLFSQWVKPGFSGGTSIIVFSGEKKIDSSAIIAMIQRTPGPYALLHAEDKKITLHVPRTYDANYIEEYLRNGFPIVQQETTDYSYFKSCIVSIKVLGPDIQITQCQKYVFATHIWAILFILLGVIL